jgi:hypothetical protein
MTGFQPPGDIFEKFLPDNQLIGQFDAKLQRLDEPQS